jgi:hypothetical protein
VKDRWVKGVDVETEGTEIAAPKKQIDLQMPDGSERVVVVS